MAKLIVMLAAIAVLLQLVDALIEPDCPVMKVQCRRHIPGWCMPVNLNRNKILQSTYSCTCICMQRYIAAITHSITLSN